MPFPPPPDGTRSCSTPPPRGGDGGDGDTRLYQGVRLGPDGKWRAEMVLRGQIVPLGHGYSTAEEAASYYDYAQMLAYKGLAETNGRYTYGRKKIGPPLSRGARGGGGEDEEEEEEGGEGEEIEDTRLHLNEQTLEGLLPPLVVARIKKLRPVPGEQEAQGVSVSKEEQIATTTTTKKKKKKEKKMMMKEKKKAKMERKTTRGDEAQITRRAKQLAK